MLIDLKDVTYTYLPGSQAAKIAVDGVSLAVESGEFIGLIGPTGSGKSTLLQVMAGLLKPSSGQLFFEGADIWREPKRLTQRRSMVGLVFQEPERQLFEMTVEKDVAFWPSNSGMGSDEIKASVKSAMEAVGLDYESYRSRSPFTLSGGEMRRVAIAGVLVIKPKVLILDEPTVGLDPRGRNDLVAQIKELNKEGTSIILVSHDMDEIAELVERVILLDQGKIIMDDSPKKVFSRRVLLAETGLRCPQVAQIATCLSDHGLHLDGLPLNLAEAEFEILTALGRLKP